MWPANFRFSFLTLFAMSFTSLVFLISMFLVLSFFSIPSQLLPIALRVACSFLILVFASAEVYALYVRADKIHFFKLLFL